MGDLEGRKLKSLIFGSNCHGILSEFGFEGIFKK